MNQQELFPDLAPVASPSVEDRTNVFDADVLWLFETSTCLDLAEFIDGAFYRLRWSGSIDDRDRLQKACAAHILSVFSSDAEFASDVSDPNVLPHSRIDSELRKFLNL